MTRTVTATTLGAHLGSAGGRYLDGRLDEFAIFPYALSVTEIQRVANGGYTYQDSFVQPGRRSLTRGRSATN